MNGDVDSRMAFSPPFWAIGIEVMEIMPAGRRRYGRGGGIEPQNVELRNVEFRRFLVG